MDQVIAIIPARGGSKGIPRKNLSKICGEPLIKYSIETALHSKVIQRVIVSTDDPEIQELALSLGAEAPFLRPKKLAADSTLDLPVFQHALTYLKQEEAYSPNFIVHLRPTAPYRKLQWIEEALNSLRTHSSASSIRSVSLPVQHPYRMFRVDQDGFLDPLMKAEHPEPYLLRRQDLPALYYYNCVLDIARASTIMNLGSMTGSRILPYIISTEDVLDIDEPQDLIWAEIFMKGRI